MGSFQDLPDHKTIGDTQWTSMSCMTSAATVQAFEQPQVAGGMVTVSHMVDLLIFYQLLDVAQPK